MEIFIGLALNAFIFAFFLLLRYQSFSKMLPSPLLLTIKKIRIPELWLSEFSPIELLQKVNIQAANDKKTNASLSDAFGFSAKTEVTLLAAAQSTPVLTNIINDINTILLKNNNNISIPQIVAIHRHHLAVAAKVAPIHSAAKIPFFIAGLVGLLFIYGHYFSAALNTKQLGGAALNFAILLFTAFLINFLTAYFLKKAQNSLQEQIYELEFFCQTELIPTTGKDLGTIIFVLQQNLESFNDKFTANMVAFEKTVAAIGNNSTLQNAFVEKINDLSLDKVANYNLQVINRFETVLEGMDKMGKWFDNLQTHTQQSIELSNRLNQLTVLCDQIGVNVATVAERIDIRLEEAQGLLRFLKTHFSELEERKQLIANAVINFDDFLQKALNGLEDHTQERVSAIKNITLREEDLMIKVFEKNRDALAHLSELRQLQPLQEQLLAFAKHYEKESAYIAQSLRSLVVKLDIVNQNLEKNGR